MWRSEAEKHFLIENREGYSTVTNGFKDLLRHMSCEIYSNIKIHSYSPTRSLHKGFPHLHSPPMLASVGYPLSSWNTLCKDYLYSF